MAVGFRATGSSTAEERISALPQVSSPYAQDLELAQRASTHEMRAQKQLAQRLIVRVRRAAHALMGGSSDADDAAQHALIEVLRAADGYTDNTSLEEWADRLTARSVVRFARAVRSRNGQSDLAESAERPELLARTLEDFLRRLPSSPREALLLREVFGFDLPETAQLIRVSRRSAREYLSRAREGLYARTGSKEPGALVFTLPDEVERWFALRDRDRSAAQEEASDIEQQLALELDPEVRLMIKELRSLAQFLDSGRFGRLASRDRKLVEGALAAVKISSRVGGNGAVLADSSETAAEHVGLSWVQLFSTGMCVLLVVAAFVSLAFYVPGSRRRGLSATEPLAAAPRAPTVEALSVARAVEGSSRLERSGSKLSQGTSMHEGDVIAARGRPGCFVLEPKADICLGTGSEARIAQLGLDTRRVELLSGRAVVGIERVGEGVPFAVSVGDLRADSNDAVLGVEIEGGKVIVRALRGTARVAANGQEQLLTSAQSAIYRFHEHDLEVVPQLIEKARRDWDLLATRTGGPARAAPVLTRSEARVPAVMAEEAEPDLAVLGSREAAAWPVAELAAPAVLEADTPALDGPGLLAQARAHARAQRWSEAEQTYERLLREHPIDQASREALVALGELQLQYLASPERALATFDRYLASGGGALDLRARYGRILALRRLARVADEQVALAQFLNLYRATPQARVLLSGARDQARAEADSTPY